MGVVGLLAAPSSWGQHQGQGRDVGEGTWGRLCFPDQLGFLAVSLPLCPCSLSWRHQLMSLVLWALLWGAALCGVLP